MYIKEQQASVDIVFVGFFVLFFIRFHKISLLDFLHQAYSQIIRRVMPLCLLQVENTIIGCIA